jgi:hypothetical protein
MTITLKLAPDLEAWLRRRAIREGEADSENGRRRFAEHPARKQVQP